MNVVYGTGRVKKATGLEGKLMVNMNPVLSSYFVHTFLRHQMKQNFPIYPFLNFSQMEIKPLSKDFKQSCISALYSLFHHHLEAVAKQRSVLEKKNANLLLAKVNKLNFLNFLKYFKQSVTAIL